MKLDFGIKGIILKDGKFLALHKSLSTDDLYELPGGRMEYGETIEETLKREIFEETTLEVEPVYLLDTWNYINSEKEHQVAGIIYLCEIKSGKLDIYLSEEHNEYRWLDPGESHLMNSLFSSQISKVDWDRLQADIVE